jgi:hypothetical protein
MQQFTRLFNNVSKGKSFSPLAELRINNNQSLEIPTSQAVLFNNFKPSLLDNSFIRYNEFDKHELASLANNLKDNQRIPIEENNKRSITISPSINFNSYLTPPSSPSMSCEEDKKKGKKSKNIGINTEETEKIESEGFCLKIPTNLSKVSIFLFISIFSIGIIII